MAARTPKKKSGAKKPAAKKKTGAKKAPDALGRLRQICLSLPEAHEVEAWGEPTFRVRNKLFAMHSGAATHHGNGRAAVWCKAAPGNQQLMVAAAPERFFVPPYV